MPLMMYLRWSFDYVSEYSLALAVTLLKYLQAKTTAALMSGRKFVH